jgi:hypothetical protein
MVYGSEANNLLIVIKTLKIPAEREKLFILEFHGKILSS